MKIGICAPFAQVNDLLALGFDYVEGSLTELADMPREDYEKLLADNVRVYACNGMIPPRYRLTGPQADLAAAEEYCRLAAERAAQQMASAFGKGFEMGSKGTAEEAPEEGTQGTQEGVAGADKAVGIGVQGTFDLNGRSISGSGLPVPVNTVQDEGRVVVNITVNPAGQVIATSINRRTNTVNPDLRKAAEDAAKRARFNVIDGVDEAHGTITYYFKLR